MEIMENEPLQVSIPLPRSLDTRIYIHLTIRAKSINLFLTTRSEDETTTPPAMGSFVYALPDVSTHLHSLSPQAGLVICYVSKGPTYTCR